MQMMNNKPKDEAPTGDLFAKLSAASLEMKDITANQLFHQYQSRVDDDVKNKKITEAQGQAKKIEAGVLTAETQLRAGLVRNDTSRVRSAYQTLWLFQKTLENRPEWNVVQVSTFDSTIPLLSKDLGKKSWAGQELFEKTSELLKERNKHELIWGFIPGGFSFIDFLVQMTGRVPSFSYAFAGFLLALIVRSLVFPLSQKQLMFSRQMSQLQPLANEIRERYKDNPQEQQAKIMALYQEYGINPAAGCAPAFVQMPLFLTVYQCMLLYQFKFQEGTFLWINPAVSKLTHGFTAPNLGHQDNLLIILYGISMVCSTLLSPVSDPNQKNQQRLMGVGISVVFTFFMFTGAFPVVAGFVLYWTFTNILATLQSLRAYKLPLPPLVKVNAKGGGVFPTDPTQGFGSKAGSKGGTAVADGPVFPWSKGGSKNGKADPPKGKSGGTGKPAQHKPKK